MTPFDLLPSEKRMARISKTSVLFFLCTLLLLLKVISCGDQDSADQPNKNTYVGSNACKSCHEDAYNDWKGSHHDLAMQEANESSVLGDFNNAEYEADGVKYKFSKSSDKYQITVSELDGTWNTYDVSHTFGVEPLQQYLVAFPGGRYQATRVSWDTEKKEWFHQYAGDRIETNDWLHWTKGGQTWNTMCAECHSTNLRKNYDHVEDVFNTTYSEINVACESCHGMGAKHLRWANEGGPDTSILVKGGIQEDEVNSCGPCHSRRVKLSEQGGPHTAYEERYMVQNVSQDYYHLDGQVREEDYVLGSFMQSQMFLEHVKCSDCHNPHTAELKMIGNELCLQCHESSYEQKEHHFHAVNTVQSECISCHMTGKYYMGNDFRRDHSFRIPRPDQSVANGTPNACVGCHSDQNDQWAATAIEKWYGSDRDKKPSDFLIASQQRQISENEVTELLTFIRDRKKQDIVRSTIVEALPSINQRQVFSGVMYALNDPSPLVRYNAIQQMHALPTEQRYDVAVKHVYDKSRMVRIAAVKLIDEISLEDIESTYRLPVRKARAELEEMLLLNADFPSGRLQLGDYYLRTGQHDAAIAQYEKALEMDHFLFTVYGNLASAYNVVGKNGEALNILNVWISLDSINGRPHYLKGLLLYEMEDTDEAIVELKRAMTLDEYNPRYPYNLANIYYRNEDMKEAKKYVQLSLEIDPDQPDANRLREMISGGYQ